MSEIIYKVSEYEAYESECYTQKFFKVRESADNWVEQRRNDLLKSWDDSSGNSIDDWYTWVVGPVKLLD